jgi:hypothetical protein
MMPNAVQVVHSFVTAAGVVVSPIGVLVPLRACRHTEPTTVGISAIGNCMAQVSTVGMHSLQ